jgi:type IV secretory pathway protease TraF
MAEPAAPPRFRWATECDNVHPTKRRRSTCAAAIALGCAPVLLTAIARPTPILVWNLSPSAPVGFYLVTPGEPVRRGERVPVWLPKGARRFADRRHYLPANVPAVKRVAATEGSEICAAGARIAIDHRVVAVRRARDGVGGPLPWWQGCRTLRPGEIFVLTAENAGSFDGRYARISRTDDVVGSVHLVWRAAGVER